MRITCNNLVSLILTTVLYLLGGLDIALKSLLIIMVIDYITGVLSAIYNQELSSKIGFQGIVKKISYLLIIALSVIIDNLTGQSGVIRSLIIYFFVANDGISILENISEMGIVLPQKISDVLNEIKKRGE